MVIETKIFDHGFGINTQTSINLKPEYEHLRPVIQKKIDELTALIAPKLNEPKAITLDEAPNATAG